MGATISTWLFGAVLIAFTIRNTTLVWAPKYRKKILTGAVGERIRELLLEIAESYRIEIEELEVSVDRVHIFYHLSLEDRLLMLLMYYRLYVSHAVLGFLFDVDARTVGRSIAALEPLLAQFFRIPERKIDLSRDEVTQLFFDSTEQATQRPGKKAEQKRHYSGKKNGTPLNIRRSPTKGARYARCRGRIPAAFTTRKSMTSNGCNVPRMGRPKATVVTEAQTSTHRTKTAWWHLVVAP